MICPICAQEFDEYKYWVCPFCEEPEPTTQEEKVIPKGPSGSVQFSAWIKLPNALKKEEGDLKVGDSVLIKNEFHAPESEKIKAAIIGEVELTNGSTKTLGLNWSTYREISKVYGDDTRDWTGRFITYQGLVPFKKGTGHLWLPKA